MPFLQTYRQLLTLLRLTFLTTQTKNRIEVTLKPALNRRFDISNQTDINYLNGLKNSYVDGVTKSDEEGNETDRSLSSQLILIATVLITANIIVFGNRDLLLSLTNAQKILMVAGLVCLIASLWSGIKYYRIVQEFHKKWSDARQAIVNTISDVDFKDFRELRDKIAKSYKGLQAHVDQGSRDFQIRVLKYSLIIYVIFVISLLFDFRFITGHFSWYK